MTKKAIWSRLKDFRCPLCGKDLKNNQLYKSYQCPDPVCGFVIGDAKLKTMVSEMLTSEPRKSRRQ